MKPHGQRAQDSRAPSCPSESDTHQSGECRWCMGFWEVSNGLLGREENWPADTLQPKGTLRLIPRFTAHWPSTLCPSTLGNSQRPPCKACGSHMGVFSSVFISLLKNRINQGFTKIMFKINQCFFQYTLWEKPRSHGSPNHACLPRGCEEARESQSYLETLVITMGTCRMPGGWEDSLIKCHRWKIWLGNWGHCNWVPFRQQAAPSVET